MHIVGIDGHLLRIDELVDEWLATGRLRVGHQATVVGAMRVVTHGHGLRGGSRCKLWLYLAATTFTLRATSNRDLVSTCRHLCNLTPWVLTRLHGGRRD